MFTLVFRGLAAGFVVVAVSEIAARFPRLGAFILTIPVVPAAVLLLMYLKAGDLPAVSGLSRQILLLIPLGLLIFVPLALAQRLHLSFWAAFIGGMLLMAAGVGAYLWMGPRSA